MKKILILFALFAGLIACENQENDFPDFKYTSGYFPYQFPVRTLVLGDYIYDNTNDNNHKFWISAAIGGVYSNNQDRIFEIGLADDLCKNVLFESTRDTIRLMPAKYYTMSSNKLIIPKGKVNGNIEIQLTDEFFDDPLAIKLGYVIPIRILNSTNLDTILQGSSIKANPDPRIANEWIVTPKNFTMFAVKYINPYHGKYLRRGISTIKDASSAVIETNRYHAAQIEQNEIWSLVTTAKNQVSVEGAIKSSSITAAGPGTLKMLLSFNPDGSCNVSGKCTITVNATKVSTDYTISGTGKFVDDADEWGNKKRDAIHMNYQFTKGTDTYSATDTLVIRDRAVVMQVYKPIVFTK